LWYAFPAFNMGFSVLPPPATCPTIARHPLGTIFFAPDGNLILQYPQKQSLNEFTLLHQDESQKT
jgi:hypothetical protein